MGSSGASSRKRVPGRAEAQTPLHFVCAGDLHLRAHRGQGRKSPGGRGRAPPAVEVPSTHAQAEPLAGSGHRCASAAAGARKAASALLHRTSLDRSAHLRSTLQPPPPAPPPSPPLSHPPPP